MTLLKRLKSLHEHHLYATAVSSFDLIELLLSMENTVNKYKYFHYKTHFRRYFVVIVACTLL